MPHAYYYDVPSTPEMYRAVVAEMDAPPGGLISHLVVRHEQGPSPLRRVAKSHRLGAVSRRRRPSGSRASVDGRLGNVSVKAAHEPQTALILLPVGWAKSMVGVELRW
jgi:hypothetical protein